MHAPSLEDRISRIKRTLELCSLDPRNKVGIEPVSAHSLLRIKETADFPEDMLLILCEIGEMRQWGISGCAVIDWWAPCRISDAIAEGRCVYDVRENNFVSSDTLLFFAWDCDAKVYFYDTAVRPWRIVSSDGLSISFMNDDVDESVPSDPFFQHVTLWDEGGDAISLIERWVTYAESSLS